jgi:hypothetical protein
MVQMILIIMMIAWTEDEACPGRDDTTNHLRVQFHRSELLEG